MNKKEQLIHDFREYLVNVGTIAEFCQERGISIDEARALINEDEGLQAILISGYMGASRMNPLRHLGDPSMDYKF
jgi:hypothetical protein